MPFAPAITGTLRAPVTFAYGRALRTARSGGRTARGCFPDGCCGGGGGGGRRDGGALVRPRGRVAMSRESEELLAVSPAVEASSLSMV